VDVVLPKRTAWQPLHLFNQSVISFGIVFPLIVYDNEDEKLFIIFLITAKNIKLWTN
jgi:hypothetical protein